MSVKPMNCPGHFLLYASEVHSYRDLPIRFHEQTPLHRNEASGVLSGLTRVRQFSQDDAHCFVTPEQIGDEVERLHSARAARLRRLRPVVHGEALDAADGVPGRDRDVGSRRGAAEGGARARGDGLYDQRRRRRVLRSEDRLRRDRRDRPQVAVRDDSARLPAAGELRPEVHRRRQHRAPAGRHPPGDFRQLRAVHRDPDRALCRGISALAGAGPGHRAADFRPPSRLRRVGPRPAEGRRAAGRSRRAPGKDRI